VSIWLPRSDPQESVQSGDLLPFASTGSECFKIESKAARLHHPHGVFLCHRGAFRENGAKIVSRAPTRASRYRKVVRLHFRLNMIAM